MDKTKISVIIPTKNEAGYVGEIITKSKRYTDDIIVVDGHSHDHTRQIAADLGCRVFLDNNVGKGEAMRLGIRKAMNEILVFIDADGSHDPDDIPRLTAPIFSGDADHVTGSRMRGGSDELHGDLAKFTRMVGSDIITLGINYRFNVRLTDSQNGFRAIRKSVAASLGLRENITTIEQEMIIKTLRHGYRIAEVPAHEYARAHGVSRINASRVWPRYVLTWIKYLFFG